MMKKFHYTNEEIAIDDMTYDQLHDAITDVVNEREGYPEGSTSKYCEMLDELSCNLQTAAYLAPHNQGRLLANELVYELQEITTLYNEGEFDNYSYSNGYDDACNCVKEAMSYLQYPKTTVTEFRQYFERAYKAVDESMYNGDHDEEDYYDGFYKGIGDAVDYLKIDHTKFEKFRLWEEKIEDNDSLQDR